MIAGVIAFTSAVALLLGITARVLEKTASLCRLPQRGIWALALLASWLLPVGMIAHANHILDRTAISASAAGASTFTAPVDTQEIRDLRAVTLVPHWPGPQRFDRALMIAWALASGTLLIIWGTTGFRLHRRARQWPAVRTNGIDVLIADDAGPAVFGYLRPRIVIPKWMLSQSKSVRTIVLQHEQSHIDARDPLLLLLGLVLTFLAPWNVALWWQLRRLRFAIEVDCDARVLGRGIAPVEYGEALLSINQRVVPAPLLAMAVTGPTSQLERRIRMMMVTSVRHRKSLIGLSLALAASLALTVTALSAPVSSTGSLVKLPPAGGSHGPMQTAVALIKERYPALLTRKITGTPVVFALFRNDDTIERTALEVFPGSAAEFKASKQQFARFGISPAAIGFMGRQGIRTRTGTVLVVYGERQSRPDTSRLFPDFRAVDRALTEHYFPQAFEHGVAAGEGIWILFGHDGSVLRTGEDSMQPTKLTRVLESRYPGIRVSAMTTTPVIDVNGYPIRNASGSDLQLNSVWLAADSPLPGAGPSPNAARSADSEFSIDAKDTDVRTVLEMIARKGKRNVLVSDQVGGKMTLHLQDVTWQQALQIVALSKGLVTRQAGDITLVGVAH
jgi:beta-lactamase regulating signal transducer with metallopeptidase domain